MPTDERRSGGRWSPHRQLTRVEIALLLREPLSLLFGLAFPLVLLLLLAGSFGSEEASEFGGVSGIDFYVPVYSAAAIAVAGLLTLPTQLAGHRERGILRRYRASGFPPGAVFGALVVTTLVFAAIGVAVMVAAGVVIYDVTPPGAPGWAVVSYAVGGLTFAAIGAALGTVLPTARAAQGLGLVVFFGLFFIAGGGPPPEVLPDAIDTFVGFTPMGPLIDAVSAPWHDGGADIGALVRLGVIALIATGVAVVVQSRAEF